MSLKFSVLASPEGRLININFLVEWLTVNYPYVDFTKCRGFDIHIQGWALKEINHGDRETTRRSQSFLILKFFSVNSVPNLNLCGYKNAHNAALLLFKELIG